MAVVQISKIQIRRGQKNTGSGLPQLSSGEFGWAIDTQELYVGNGAVSEGAPNVGNTKVLTEHDNLFSLIDTYGWRTGDPYIVTGESATKPHLRTLQARLDDWVTGRAFGLTGVALDDATIKLQQAVDQLYMNSATIGSEASRITLYLDPGVYSVASTIYLPPFVTIMGAGVDKTIIKKSTAGPLFKTENELASGIAEKTTRDDDSGSSYLNQARHIRIENLSLDITVPLGKGLVLQSCRDSIFKNIKITGPWVSGNSLPTDFSSDMGIELNSLSGDVESSGNTFDTVSVQGYSYGVMSNWDISNNLWNDCTFKDLGYGFTFGVDMVLGAAGQVTGPFKNSITHCFFERINFQGIWVQQGINNVSSHNRFISVGNDGSGDGVGGVSIIKFNKVGNVSENDYFSRTAVLSYDQTYLTNSPYIPEVEGPVNWTWGSDHSVTMPTGTNIKLFKLPQVTNQTFEIDYTLASQSYNTMRSGTLSIDIHGSTKDVEFADDFHYTGDETYLNSIVFSTALTDENGDATDETVAVSYTSTMPGDDQSTLTFRVKNKQAA